MSDLETRLHDLLHEQEHTFAAPASLLDGARRHARRARRARRAATAALIVAVVGVGGAVASGALRDRALSPADPHPSTPTLPHLPAGPSWVQTGTVTDRHGNTFSLNVGAVITTPGNSTPSSERPGKYSFTGPTMAGYYTLTNTGSAAHDIAQPVVVFAYWKVPAGFCARYDTFIALAQVPVPATPDGQELCPMAMGDSTLAQTPQTFQVDRPVLVDIVPNVIGLRQDYPLQLSNADADTALRATRTPPAAWAAFDSDLSTVKDTRILSTNLP
jgi:hypothetical protein